MKRLLIFLIISNCSATSNTCVTDTSVTDTSVMDTTLTGRERLTESELVVQERMQDKQLALEREKLLVALKLNEPVSQMSGKTKIFFYTVGGAFLIGTIGIFRKFVWVSNKVFTAKDWVCKKSNDLWYVIVNGREIKISKSDYDNLKKEIRAVNKQLHKARKNNNTCVDNTGVDDTCVVDTCIVDTCIVDADISDIIPDDIKMPASNKKKTLDNNKIKKNVFFKNIFRKKSLRKACKKTKDFSLNILKELCESIAEDGLDSD